MQEAEAPAMDLETFARREQGQEQPGVAEDRIGRQPECIPAEGPRTPRKMQ